MDTKILILAVLVLLVSGCATTNQVVNCNKPYIPVGNVCCVDQNSNNICDIDEVSAQESLKYECPHECCTGTDFKTKPCSGGTVCDENRCVKPNCPYQCCSDEYYKTKNCEYNKDCVNNQCVVAPCPYECCTGDVYQTKTCSSGYVCTNDKCTEIKIPKLSTSIDACYVGNDLGLFAGLGEYADLYVTLRNYGTKEANTITVTSTSTDVGRIVDSSKASIASIGAGEEIKFRLSIDTETGKDTYATVNAHCNECVPSTISTSTGNCYVNLQPIEDKFKEYITFTAETVGELAPVKIG